LYLGSAGVSDIARVLSEEAQRLDLPARNLFVQKYLVSTKRGIPLPFSDPNFHRVDADKGSYQAPLDQVTPMFAPVE